MKRDIFNLGVMVVSGILLSCCMAFACVLIAQTRSGIVHRMTSEDVTALSHRNDNRLFIGTANHAGNSRLDSFGYREFKMGAVATLRGSDGTIEFGGHLTVSEIDAGWPLKSFRRTAFTVYPLDETGRFLDQYTAYGPSSAAPQLSVVSEDVDGFLIPIRPLWMGLAVNSSSYAALLWTLIALPGILRRAIRARRGLCLNCAYPVGANDRCTECGATIAAHIRQRGTVA